MEKKEKNSTERLLKILIGGLALVIIIMIGFVGSLMSEDDNKSKDVATPINTSEPVSTTVESKTIDKDAEVLGVYMGKVNLVTNDITSGFNEMITLINMAADNPLIMVSDEWKRQVHAQLDILDESGNKLKNTHLDTKHKKSKQLESNLKSVGDKLITSSSHVRKGIDNYDFDEIGKGSALISEVSEMMGSSTELVLELREEFGL